TTDPSQIKNWWGKWPYANIGIAAGKESDIIVIDIDPRHNGTKTLKMLEAKFGPLPRTMTSHTGDGGEHRFFKYPSFDVKSDIEGKVFGSHGQFWEFEVKFWRQVTDPWMLGKVLEAIQANAVNSGQNTASLVNQTVALLKAKLAVKEDRLSFAAEPPRVINCSKGELWINDDGSVDLRRHRPDSFP